MKNKKIYFKGLVFVTIILLIAINFIPTISGNLVNHRNNNTNSSNINPPELTTNNKAYYRVCQYVDGNCKKIINMPMDFIKKGRLIGELREILSSEISLYDKFDQFLETIKSYGFASTDITLEDFLDTEVLIGPFDQVNNTNFKAHFAPIIILGGGIGLGLGEVYRPVNVFLHFLAIMGGLAWIFCLDPIENILYQLTSFLLPLFIGYISSYTGLIMFAVYPGFFYSNIVAIGFTPFTTWVLFPPEELNLK